MINPCGLSSGPSIVRRFISGQPVFVGGRKAHVLSSLFSPEERDYRYFVLFEDERFPSNRSFPEHELSDQETTKKDDSPMSQTYKWGDKVWFKDYYGNFLKGVIVKSPLSIHPIYIVHFASPDGIPHEWNVNAGALSPRTDDDTTRPRTWRLPENGDTVEVVDPTDSSFGRKEEIVYVNYRERSQVETENRKYTIDQLKCVRLHDDPAPGMSSRKFAPGDKLYLNNNEGDPDCYCEFKQYTRMEYGIQVCEIGLIPTGEVIEADVDHLSREPKFPDDDSAPPDHVVDANKKVEPAEDHVAGAGKVIEEQQNLIGRIIVIKGPDSNPWKGWMGQIVSPSITGKNYVVKMINGAMHWPLVGDCELLPSDLADGWEGLVDAMEAGIAWGIGQKNKGEEHKAKRQSSESDPVEHPRHYNTHPSGIECIEVARHFNFNIGNVIKYVWRCDEKDAPIQDLEKAAWYLNDEIERRKKGKS